MSKPFSPISHEVAETQILLEGFINNDELHWIH